MKKHTMTLLGGTRGELRVPADVLLETVGALLEGARQATRFFVEGESTRKGPRPAWLDGACNVEVTGLTAGSAVVALEAPALAEAAPDRFGGGHQVSLFAEPQQLLDASHSAVDIFAGVLASVVRGHVRPDADLSAILRTAARTTYSTTRRPRYKRPGVTSMVMTDDDRNSWLRAIAGGGDGHLRPVVDARVSVVVVV